MGKFICEICNKPFINNKKVGITCSMECRHIRCQRNSKAVIKKCSWCKKTIRINPSKLKEHNCCSFECAKKFLSSKKGDWKYHFNNNKSISHDGYYWYSDKKIHRLIMEEYLGRKLLSSEIVHHINGNKLDNKINNLIVVSRSEHNKIHNFLNRRKNDESHIKTPSAS